MNLTDLTDLVENNNAVLKQIIDLLPAPIYLKDVQGRYLNCNQAFAELWNRSPNEIIGNRLIDLSDHVLATELHHRDLSLLDSLGSRVEEFDATALVERHCILHVHARATRDRNDNPTGIVGIAFDITARVNIEQELETLSQIDELTQIPNRRHGMATLEKLISHSERHKFEFTLLILDIDFFKAVNDGHGHKAGDEVLAQIAALFAEVARVSDTVFRYGGEEFFVILPNTDPKGGMVLAERFRAEVQKAKFTVNLNSHISLSTSAGIAFYPEHGTTMGKLFLAADQALYRAKNNGRNRVEPAI
jgi:diguanylate cyclase (GGDEF)-like protein/PAS domain S-box-containing protein